MAVAVGRVDGGAGQDAGHAVGGDVGEGLPVAVKVGQHRQVHAEHLPGRLDQRLHVVPVGEP
ncbi:hypothetical protein [Blastococcus capsensis]|uniref:hypothetical protein n=1 Tax=Blastococcus capsensis TaxID=1564163 RepID=UPI00254210CE|nr:hypothetical protein [Blastococcus capsensis]MDK3258902.1 hypothetical protein [Blastococcus capsensis]